MVIIPFMAILPHSHFDNLISVVNHIKDRVGSRP
jgi:hypothetical protein